MFISELVEWFWESFGITGAVVLGIILLLLLIIFARRYFIGIVLDYIVNLGFTILDIFLILPAIGIPLGSIIAGILIFLKERTVTNTPAAIVVGWEASGFFPLPLFLARTLIITAIFPAATITRIFFMKYRAAKEQAHSLEEHIALASDLDIRKADEEAVLSTIQKKLRYEDYTHALLLGRQMNKDIIAKLRERAAMLIDSAKQLRRKTEESYGLQPDQNDGAEAVGRTGIILLALRDCSDLIVDAEEELGRDDFSFAVMSARKARQTIEDAVESVPVKSGGVADASSG